MRNWIILSLMLVTSLGSCQQNKSAKIKIQNMDQKMLDIYKHVKTYQYDPWYEIEYSQDACGYEILINDLPIARHFLFGSTNEQRIQINDQILGSGKQTITIRMFPPQLSDKSYSPVLVGASKFSIKVLHRKTNGALEDYVKVFEFKSPNKSASESFEGAGRNFFEFKGVFDAEVPYQIEGWKNSKDLSKEDKRILEKEVINAYNNFREILSKKKSDSYASLMYEKEVELAKSYYWATPKDSKDRWNDMKEDVLENKEILPLSEYKMVLYGDNKVVALVPTSIMYKDFLSAIHGQTKESDMYYTFYLHKKAGTNELSPIR